MAHRFIVPDSSPPGSPGLSTPEKTPQIRGLPTFGEHPSTTPAGPPPAPPSSAPSFTPAGAPTESYLGSSIMRGVTNPRQQPSFGGGFSTDSPGRNLFGSGRGQSPANAPLGRSIMGGGSQRQPSGLSRGFSMNDDDALDEDAEGEDDDLFSAPPPGSLFRPSLGPGNNFGAAPDDTNNEIGRLLEKDMGFGGFGHGAGQEEESEEEESEEDEQEEEELPQLDSRAGEEEDADMFLNMRHDDRPYGQPALGEEDDLMMMHTPAATNKVRREAEALLRRSSAHQGLAAREKGHEYASIAKDLYSHAEVARLDEPTSVILKTEALVSRLYDEGVGAEDDEEKLDNSLASITYQLVKLWTGHVRSLDRPQEEDLASVGPGVHAAPFEKAAYVAHLLLRLHHTRYEDDEPDYSSSKAQPLPGVLLHWLQDSGYNPYPDQVDDVMRYQPSPACHSLFWQTVQNSLLRGDVAAAVALLRNAGWEHVRRGAGLDRERVYTGQSLENVERFVASTCDTLEQCPSQSDDWDIFDSNWTLFRIQARGTLDRMMLFAEGRDQTFQDPMGGGFGVQQSLSTMARKASSQLPWDVYENLQNIYGILLGDSEAIVGTAQDWCEATVGMFVWWDDGSSRNRSLRLPQHQNLLTASTASAATSRTNAEYLERLSGAFHAVLQSDLSPNAMNAVEVAVASVFEGNVEGVIGLLRTWSLPVACSVAEVASLGRWLPPRDASASGGRGGLPAGMVDAFDVEDLALLNISQPGPDELLGIKDDTLERYARDLAGIEQLSPQREGWEMAIEVLGRMDAPEKSEEIVGELLKDILATLDENSAATVDKMWTILNHLGMINFAEETAETFADTLSNESHRYGEALWYYALAHRTDKVREVLNLLMSYSLVQSTAYPPERDLDEELRNLLSRRTQTLERRAKQDLEAAQLLGRMLSGYATLRKFYELRDELGEANGGDGASSKPTAKASKLRKQAALALVAVISSADDNIRGGLYDETRDAVVSEDFLLALLGEATVFVNNSASRTSGSPALTLDQIDIVLKAIEDMQTVGSRVYKASEDFFNLVLTSAQALKGSTPADLMTTTTGSSLGGSSYMVMSGSSVLAGHMHKSVSAGGAKVRRGWDWRKTFSAGTKADFVLRRLRLGLAKDLAGLWLEDADGVAVY